MFTLNILCENSVIPCPGLLGEHGFSVLIERRDRTFLFDTGQGHTIVQNAKVLKKNLRKISKIFLSHGHFDHTGGLAAVVKECGRMDVYAHPDVFNERFAVTHEKGKDKIRSVGLPEEKEDLCALGAVFHFNTNFEEVFNGVFLTGEIPRKTRFEKEDKRLAVIENNEMVQDPFKDDQSLVIKTEMGLLVILGCAHSGMINTLDHIKGYFPDEKFHMIIGGTHMGFLDDLQVEKTIEALKVFNIDKIGVSHCTGLKAAASLKQAFGKKFFFAQAGTIIKVN
jgi:7,8-dihydropterin-6-yl-methyl-4-(beta-D-ribofuranosyl)aminobenzene 5'-phosphate synthase